MLSKKIFDSARATGRAHEAPVHFRLAEITSMARLVRALPPVMAGLEMILGADGRRTRWLIAHVEMETAVGLQYRWALQIFIDSIECD